MYLQSNLKQLALSQDFAWKTLQAIEDSDYSLSPNGINFLGFSFPIPESKPLALPEDLTILTLYGMGDGDWASQLLKAIPPTCQVWILDPQPDLAWLYLHDFDLQTIVSDPRVRWWVGSAESLITEFSKASRQAIDQYGFVYLENPLLASLGERFQNPLLHYLRQEHQRHQALPSLSYLALQLGRLYQSLDQPIQRAYQSYSLTCQQGCADCCKSSVGYHLCINPLEWLHLYQSLWHLPASERRLVYQRSVRLLAKHADYLSTVLHFFDRQPERFYDSRFHLELLSLAGDQRKQACVFLDSDDTCQVYQGRTLTCRIFGNSYGLQAVPFTCDKDSEYMEQIILDEGPANQMVSAAPYRQHMQTLHQTLPYKQIINAWVFTHLDFDRGDFLPQARLCYQQFQELANHPEQLSARLQRLLEEANSLA